MIIPESEKIEKKLTKGWTKYHLKKFKDLYKGQCGYIAIADNGDIGATLQHVKFFMDIVINDPNVSQFVMKKISEEKAKLVIDRLLSE